MPRDRRGVRLLAVVGLFPLLALGFAVQVARSYFSHTVLSDVRGAPFPAPAFARRLVVVLYDGLRADVAFRPGVMPTLQALAEGGASGIALTGEVPMTGIGVRTIGTGTTPDLLDVVRNWDNRPVEFDNIFESAHEAGKSIAFIGDEPWLQLFGAWADFAYSVPDLGIADLDQSDPKVWQAALVALESHRYEIEVVHFVGTDHTGHAFGSSDSRYAAKAHELDGFLAAAWPIISASGDTALCVLADHGSAPNGNHGSGEPEARRTPFVLAGSGIARAHDLAISQLDFAVTFAALLGLPYPAPSEGRIVTEALAAPDSVRATLLADNVRQRIRYLDRYAARTGAMQPPRGDLIEPIDDAIGRGDDGRAVSEATRLLRSLEQQYRRSLEASPVYSYTWMAILALAVVAGFALVVGEAGGTTALACTSALAVALLHLLRSAQVEAVSIAIAACMSLAAVAATRTVPAAVRRSRLLGGLLLCAVVAAIPSRAEVPLAAAALVTIDLTLTLRGSRRPGWRELLRPALFVAVGVPVSLAWFRLGWQLSELRFPGPTWLSSNAALTLAAAVTSAVLYTFLFLDAGTRRNRLLIAAGALLAVLALWIAARLDVAAAGARTDLLANALIAVASLLLLLGLVVPVPAGLPRGQRGSVIMAAAMPLLLLLSHGAALALTPALVLFAERMFARRPEPSAPGVPGELGPVLMAAASLALARLCVFGVTEGRFYFSAVDLKNAFLGGEATQSLVRPVLIVFGRFALPFVLLALAAVRRQRRLAAERVLTLTAVLLVTRLAAMAIEYRVALHRFWLLYDLIGEMTFYVAFVVTLGIAALLWRASVRGEERDTSSSRGESVRGLEPIEPRLEVA